MKRSNKTRAEKDAENRFAVRILIGFQSISGLVIGAIAVVFLRNLILSWTGLELVWWYGALFGLLIGIVSGVVQARRLIEENLQFEQAAERLGLMPLCDDDLERVHRETNLLVSGFDCRVWNGFFQSHKEGHIVLCESGFEERDEEHGSEVQQTTAYFEFETIRLPEFQIQPATRGMRKAARILGSNEVSVPGQAAFAQKYFASGPKPDSIRQLIDQELLRHLLPDGAWHVYAKTNRILVFKMGTRVPLDRLGAFFSTAVAIADALVGKAATLSKAVQPAPMTRDQAITQASKIGGLAGWFLKRQMEREAIDAEALSEFVNQQPPRQIPTPIRNQFSLDPFLTWMAGTAVALGGLLGGVATLAPGVDSSSRTFTGIAGSVLIAGGTSGLLLMLRSVARKRQTLRNGKLRWATIQSVAQSPHTSGNQQVYDVAIRLSDATEGAIEKVRLKGAAAMAALDLMEHGQPIRVLQDRRHPRRLILIDCHALQ